jgi:hypothetical protein
MNPIRALKPDYTGTMAHEDEVRHLCDCGSFVWLVKASFDDYEISSYFLDMECASCGSYAKAPTPLDRPTLL